MDRRRVLLSLAGFGVAVVISTPGIASDLCKSPRLGVTPAWCDTKSTEKAVPEGHVANSHESATSGLKTHTANRTRRAFRPPKSLRPQTGHKTSARR
jgi:hypothetical protein